jgi:hypothetical protein
MAFLKNSRYHALPTVEVTTKQGRSASAVKLRRLPTTSGTPYRVDENDRLDLIADSNDEDPTGFWRIADANTELEANSLIEPNTEIEVPE